MKPPLQRAYTFLQQASLSSLTEREQATLLAALPTVAELATLRYQLAQQLHQLLQPEWFAHSSLEDIFTVCNALHAYDSHLITGSHIAYAAKRLVLAEVSIGGPYMSASGVAEAATNAQIALCMQWAGAPLPRVLQFLEQYLMEQAVAPPSNQLLVVLQGLVQLPQDSLKKKIQTYLDAAPAAASTAQAILLLNIRQKLASHRLSADVLIPVLQGQKADGGWSGPRLPDMGDAATSLVLTATAAALLAEHPPKPTVINDTWKQQHKAVFAASLQTFQAQAEPLRSCGLQVVRHIQHADDNYEVGLLPAFVAAAIQLPANHATALGLLGQANVFAWMAIEIYDDFYDDEGEPVLLPAANTALRLSIEHYRQALPDDNDFQQFIARSFDTLDTANTWEISYCRFPISKNHITIGELPKFDKRQMLANRAYMHALGPLAVLRLQGAAIGGSQWQQLDAGLRHYLIARQLNDDIHDCFEDLAAGNITYVVAELLRHAHIKPAVYHLEQLQKHLRGIFWQEVLPDILATAQEHVNLSRQALQQVQLLRPGNQLYALIDTIEQVLVSAEAERKQSQDFLRVFETE